MLKKKRPKQSKLEMVSIDQLVPQDHLLRKIDAAIDFSFIEQKAAPLYSKDNGRPAIHPEVLFKILFIGYLFGIRSERQLMREIQVNVAYRWFAGFDLTDKIPDPSVFSKNRKRRFNDRPEIFQDIFDEIVRQAAKRKLVAGKILYTDSTHIQANANKHKVTKKLVEKSRAAYLDDLDRAVTEDREAHGLKPLIPKEEEPEVKQVQTSTTDPDARWMKRDRKPQGFFYLDHRTVDGQANIIVDTYITPGNVNDDVPYLDRLDRVRERFGFDVEAVGLDAGYGAAFVCQGLEERKIEGVIADRRPKRAADRLDKRDFLYDPEQDCYICPRGHRLGYQTTDREGRKEYRSKVRDCRSCLLHAPCTKRKDGVKIVRRHVWEGAKERALARRLTEEGGAIFACRQETVERSFADAKELHGHRNARMRGLSRVSEQALLSAACQNMKKIALALFLQLFPVNTGVIPHYESRRRLLERLKTNFALAPQN